MLDWENDISHKSYERKKQQKSINEFSSVFDLPFR